MRLTWSKTQCNCVSCHNFPVGLQLPSQFPPTEHHCPLTGSNLYWLMTEAHTCERLTRGCFAAVPIWELNQRSLDCKSDAILIVPPIHHRLFSTVFCHLIECVFWKTFVIFRSTSTLVPGASNKLVCDWLSDWIHSFSPWASSAMEAVKETKLGTKVAYGWRWCPNFEYMHSAEKVCDTTIDDEK